MTTCYFISSTTRIDRRFGFYQEKFILSGNEVRLLSTKQPRLITYSLHHVNTNIFALKEEMGFNQEELKQLVLKKPKLYMLGKFLIGGMCVNFHYLGFC